MVYIFFLTDSRQTYERKHSTSMSAGQHEEDPKIRRMQDHTGYRASGSKSSARWETLSRGPVLNQFEDSGGHVVCHCSTSKKARRDQLPNNCPFSSDPDPYTGDRLKSKSATIVVFLVPNYASYYQVMLPFASAEEPFTKTGTLRVLFIFE